MKNISIECLEDAKICFQNSGFLEWDWFEGFTEESFINAIYNHADEHETLESLTASYLRENNQNIADYFPSYPQE